MRAPWIGPAIAAIFAVLCAAPTCTPDLGDLDLFDDLDTIYVDDWPVSVLFENFSSFDIELSVTYDDVDDVVFIPFDDAIVVDLEWCPVEVLVWTEDHFDPFTGLFVEGFDWSGGDLDAFLDFDYFCGETLAYTFSDFEVEIDAFEGFLKETAKPHAAKRNIPRRVSRPAPREADSAADAEK